MKIGRILFLVFINCLGLVLWFCFWKISILQQEVVFLRGQSQYPRFNPEGVYYCEVKKDDRTCFSMRVFVPDGEYRFLTEFEYYDDAGKVIKRTKSIPITGPRDFEFSLSQQTTPGRGADVYLAIDDEIPVVVATDANLDFFSDWEPRDRLIRRQRANHDLNQHHIIQFGSNSPASQFRCWLAEIPKPENLVGEGTDD